MNKKRGRRLVMFLCPAIIVLLLLTVYPFVYNICLSLTNSKLGRHTTFVGWNNYLDFFTGDGLSSLVVTLAFVFGTTSISFLLGFILALLLYQDIKAKTFIRSVLIYPLVVSPAAIGLMGMLMWDKDIGILNYLISLFHLSRRAFLSDPSTALLTVIATDVWQWTGFMMLVLLAGRIALPRQPYEAAIVDGASTIQIFRFITLPLMVGSILVALLFRTMDAFKVFDLVYFMTGGGPGSVTTVLNFYGYRRAFKYFDMGYSATIAIITIVLAIGISQTYIYIFRKVWKREL